MKRNVIIQFFFHLIFFSLDHGITDHFLSWHVVTKLHVMNIFFKLIFFLICQQTGFASIRHDVYMIVYYICRRYLGAYIHQGLNQRLQENAPRF
jgi:hypothetical protein